MIHLAIDIGASSGRHIVGRRGENGEMQLTEVYRFPNLPSEADGRLTWDIDRLVQEVINGLCECKKQGIIPDSVGIDTWAVDYVLLDENKAPVYPVYCYRDKRGGEAAVEVQKIIPHEKLYAVTGIQYQPFNTVYQLFWDKQHGRLDGAKYFLMLPEYLSYILSGVMSHEYTNATSTGLLDAAKKTWSREIIGALGLKEELFTDEPKTPPIVLGKLKKEIADKAGFNCGVILPCTHDTASAIATLPCGGAYISSGTWSLLGAQLPRPFTGKDAMRANFTNEGGVGSIRFLKNINGLWLIQCLRREYKEKYTFPELEKMAAEQANFDYDLQVNEERYMAPQSVTAEICAECKERGLPLPKTPGEFAHAIYQSLAHAYASAFDELEIITRTEYGTVYIVGGGSKNKYLNELTQRATGKKVVTGASEATALGNVLMQEKGMKDVRSGEEKI